jgi:DNA-binding transcriptional MerR regulator
MPYKEQETVKVFYSIGEVAEMFKVAPSLLRFWEKEFSTLLHLSKDSRGNRQYTQDDISKIKILNNLIKEQGYTLEGAKKHFRETVKESKGTEAIEKSLEKIKADLLALKKKLSA